MAFAYRRHFKGYGDFGFSLSSIVKDIVNPVAAVQATVQQIGRTVGVQNVQNKIQAPAVIQKIAAVGAAPVLALTPGSGTTGSLTKSIAAGMPTQPSGNPLNPGGVPAPQPIYEDAQGNVITQAQYNALMAAQQPAPTTGGLMTTIPQAATAVPSTAPAGSTYTASGQLINASGQPIDASGNVLAVTQAPSTTISTTPAVTPAVAAPQALTTAAGQQYYDANGNPISSSQYQLELAQYQAQAAQSSQASQGASSVVSSGDGGGVSSETPAAPAPAAPVAQPQYDAAGNPIPYDASGNPEYVDQNGNPISAVQYQQAMAAYQAQAQTSYSTPTPAPAYQDPNDYLARQRLVQIQAKYNAGQPLTQDDITFLNFMASALASQPVQQAVPVVVSSPTPMSVPAMPASPAMSGFGISPIWSRSKLPPMRHALDTDKLWRDEAVASKISPNVTTSEYSMPSFAKSSAGSFNPQENFSGMEEWTTI